MVTYSELFQLCLVLIGFASLIIQIWQKKMTAPCQGMRSISFDLVLG